MPPYTGSTREEIRDKAARGDLTDAVGRLDASGVEVDLVALAKACLAAEVGQRPRNAGTVVEGHSILLDRSSKSGSGRPSCASRAHARAEEEANRRTMADQLGEAGACGRGSESVAGRQRARGISLVHIRRHRRRSGAFCAAAGNAVGGDDAIGYRGLPSQSVCAARPEATPTDLTKWF